ncbi:MAG: hypothetical protein QXI00_00740 [Sulfolobales archaeon]
MWLATSSVYLAFLSLTDTWLFLYLAIYLGADPLTLGLASSLWSIVFVASNILFGRFVEEGLNKVAAFISSILLCLSVFTTVNSRGVIGVAAGYALLHAVSASLGRTAVNVTLLEYVNYEAWSRYNYFFNYVTLSVRGLLLILVYLGLITSTTLLLLTLAVSIVYALTLPSVVLPVERTLYRLAKQLDKVYAYMKFTSILPEIVDTGLTASGALELRWNIEKEVASYRPLLGAFILVASSDALFIIVPSLLSNYIGRGQTLLVYGISSLASALALVAISRVSKGRLTSLISGLARALLIPLVTCITGVEQAVVYLLATAILFNVFNTSSYNVYITSTSGQRTFLYGVAVELGSAVGSIVGGILASNFGIEYLLAFSMIGHVIASIVAS